MRKKNSPKVKEEESAILRDADKSTTNNNYTLKRVYLETETLGSIYAPDGTLVCKTMELPWKGNKKSISCIPEGVYEVFKNEPKPSRNYPYFRFKEVKGRSGILIHRITYVEDLAGCIGVGSGHVDLNKDGVPDMVESSKTLQSMIDNLPEEFKLEIIEKYGQRYALNKRT